MLFGNYSTVHYVTSPDLFLFIRGVHVGGGGYYALITLHREDLNSLSYL
jgi:hypothetical protein